MAKMRAGLVALAFLGWCGFAHALALGEIEVHSRLNQVLSADIPLTVSTPGEADDLVVELASNEEFDRVGMERSEFLSALRFAVDGTTIKVTSKQIAREPFISFLLNVRWGKGHLLREYTVLLDPPPMAESGISKSHAATQAATESSTPTPMAPKPAGEAPPPAPAEAAEAPSSAAPAATASVSGGMYGPVSPKETLWSIAYKLRPDPSLTMDQMQVAFFNANPKAFDNGKLTGLMKGSMLRVPTTDEIRAVDPASAKVQVAAARNASPSPVVTARAEPAPAPKAAPAPAPVETTPPPKAETAPAPAPAPQAQQPAPTPPPTQRATPQPPPAEAPPTEVAQAPQQAPAATSAAAPSEAPATTPAPAPTPVPAVEEKKSVPAAAPPAEENDLVATIMTTVKDLADNEMVRYALAGLVALIILILVGRKVGNVIAKARYDRASRKQTEAKMAPMAGGGDEEVTQVAGAPSMEQALDEASSDAPAHVTATQTQSMAPVAATQAIGDATLQQTMQQTQVQEPAMAQSGQVDFDVTGTFADQTVQIKLDAGDPVSEAEFHRAYGLYDEAALLLKQALQKDPKRTDARVKLAEIYFEASKANEFVEVAKELKGQLPDAEWQKIALLGTQIAPSNELFSGGGAGVGGTVDLSFDEPAAAAPAAAPAAPVAAPAAADAGLEFKLEDVQLDVPAAAPAAAAPAAPAEGALEFDLGSMSLDTPAETPAAAGGAVAAAPAAPAADGGLDLGDFDLGAAPAATQGGSGEIVEMSADMGDSPAAGDESSTKLDLARAYIDMGDNDMAKSLLNEVSQQGNDQQKKEAQELLKRVAA